MPGTALGDPIEVGAALAAFAGAGARPLELQAAKSRLLHTEPAAGAVGLAMLGFRMSQEAAQPTLHLRAVNPHVGSVLEGAARQPGARRAAARRQAAPPLRHSLSGVDGVPAMGSVSSFAYQGTNSHAVLATASGWPPVGAIRPQPWVWHRSRLWYQVTSHPLVWSFGRVSPFLAGGQGLRRGPEVLSLLLLLLLPPDLLRPDQRSHYSAPQTQRYASSARSSGQGWSGCMTPTPCAAAH